MLETKAGRERKGTNWGGTGRAGGAGRVEGEGWVIKYNDMPILNTITKPIMCMLTLKLIERVSQEGGKRWCPFLNTGPSIQLCPPDRGLGMSHVFPRSV